MFMGTDNALLNSAGITVGFQWICLYSLYIWFTMHRAQRPTSCISTIKPIHFRVLSVSAMSLFVTAQLYFVFYFDNSQVSYLQLVD